MVVRFLNNSVADRTCPVVAEPAFAAGERLATVAAAASCLDIADTDWERFPEDPVPDLAVVPIDRLQALAHSIDREHLEIQAVQCFAQVALAIAWVGNSGIAAGFADMVLAAVRFAELETACCRLEQNLASHKNLNRKKRKEESN